MLSPLIAELGLVTGWPLAGFEGAVYSFLLSSSFPSLLSSFWLPGDGNQRAQNGKGTGEPSLEHSYDKTAFRVLNLADI